MDEEKKRQVATFRFGVIHDLAGNSGEQRPDEGHGTGTGGPAQIRNGAAQRSVAVRLHARSYGGASRQQTQNVLNSLYR